jgi:hypothetical protein
VDDVHGVAVQLGQPRHTVIQAGHDLVVVEGPVTRLEGREDRASLVTSNLILAAVHGVQQQLGQVAAGTEELHVLWTQDTTKAAADSSGQLCTWIYRMEGSGYHALNLCRKVIQGE